MPSPAIPPGAADRRSFVKKVFAGVLGAVALLSPLAAGVTMFFDPVRRRKRQDAGMIKVATLDSVPKDGLPRKFAVVASRTDAWNRFPRVPVGAVYLRRTGPRKVEAFNVACPHAGCLVDFDEDNKSYLCPCHNSTFTVEGKRSADSPSPRDLDALEVQVRKDNGIYVKFQQFQMGQAAKVPLA
ncbi:MAG TPA: Rieske 2Fe-2S domain-containing protein [Verrucomicrobiae bacterium]|jgi:Rieske Fe-S protein